MDQAGTSPQGVTRLDGRVKVTGAALYGADWPPPIAPLRFS